MHNCIRIMNNMICNLRSVSGDRIDQNEQVRTATEQTHIETAEREQGIEREAKRTIAEQVENGRRKGDHFAAHGQRDQDV
jgi:hypothetical protein